MVKTWRSLTKNPHNVRYLLTLYSLTWPLLTSVVGTHFNQSGKTKTAMSISKEIGFNQSKINSSRKGLILLLMINLINFFSVFHNMNKIVLTNYCAQVTLNKLICILNSLWTRKKTPLIDQSIDLLCVWGRISDFESCSGDNKTSWNLCVGPDLRLRIGRVWE